MAGGVDKKQSLGGGSYAAGGSHLSIDGHSTNPLTHRPFSPNYWRIFETRKTLPVYAQREQFKEMLASAQCMILVGETGSGSVARS
ncbi:MAG: hypothetical protein Q7T57_04135 [Dehalococcoidales bacterium]|nr:hypothetical protein [Dehalococcoidales bacterium]